MTNCGHSDERGRCKDMLRRGSCCECVGRDEIEMCDLCFERTMDEVAQWTDRDIEIIEKW